MVSKKTWSVALSRLIDFDGCKGGGEKVPDIVDVLVWFNQSLFGKHMASVCHSKPMVANFATLFASCRHEQHNPVVHCFGHQVVNDLCLCGCDIFVCSQAFGSLRFVDGDLRGMPVWQSLWFYGIVFWIVVQMAGLWCACGCSVWDLSSVVCMSLFF